MPAARAATGDNKPNKSSRASRPGMTSIHFFEPSDTHLANINNHTFAPVNLSQIAPKQYGLDIFPVILILILLFIMFSLTLLLDEYRFVKTIPQPEAIELDPIETYISLKKQSD